MNIGIIDYGAGNTMSVINALKRLEQNYFVSDQPTKLEQADKLILPGVGNAQKAMLQLRKKNLDDYLKAINKQVLGICLGMQLLTEYTEEQNTDCLQIIAARCRRFNQDQKVPKIGWNTVQFEDTPLFKNIPKSSYFYFVHSYFVPLDKSTIASTNYGTQYSAAIRKDLFYGVQFHPEKSGKAGLKLIKNFIEL